MVCLASHAARYHAESSAGQDSHCLVCLFVGLLLDNASFMVALRAFQFRLPMRRLRLAGREYQERTGLLFCDAATGTRWGEASPLPGFSRESLDDVIAAWRQGPPLR